jgi:hypothetical protein
MRIEFDPAKDEANIRKHGISLTRSIESIFERQPSFRTNAGITARNGSERMSMSTGSPTASRSRCGKGPSGRSASGELEQRR